MSYRIGFFGDSFCEEMNNSHSITNNYLTYLEMLEKNNFKIDSLGHGGSSIWDCYINQFLPKYHNNILPDVIVFMFASTHRLYHPLIRNINAGTVIAKDKPQNLNPGPNEKLIWKVAKDYFVYLYDQEKDLHEHNNLIYFLDNEIFSKISKPIICCWYKKQITYNLKNAAEVNTSLFDFCQKGEEQIKLGNDPRPNHISGNEKNYALYKCIVDGIKNYKAGKKIKIDYES